MSLLTMGRGRRGSAAGEPPQAGPDDAPGRRIAHERRPQSDQHSLGSVTLQAVDQLTGMTAVEIEKLADRLVDAAQEVAGTLRECARRVRQNGEVANERLAAFVAVANNCAEAARLLQAKIERRDEVPPVKPPEPPPPVTPVPATAYSPDLHALAKEIGTALDDERSGPT